MTRSGVSGLFVLALGLGSLAVFWAGPVSAQTRQRVGTCEILPGTLNMRGRSVGGSLVTYVSRPRLACEGGIRIRADSMVNFESTGYNQLFGNVFFEDATQQLLAENARYFDQVGRLEADGDVRLTDKESGNVVEGQNLLYLRAGFGRQQEELTVWGGRPRALLTPGGGSEGGASPDADPYDVTGNRIFLRGESYFQATGDVEVVRDSLNAFSDTLRYDERGQRLLLTREARVDQAQYDLEGDEILLHAPGDTIRKVEARGHGRLVGEDLDLEAPYIRVGFEAGLLNALWATPLKPGQELEMTVGLRVLPAELDSADLVRPEARSTDFHVVADSLEVQAPDETLEELFAVGRARAVSTARDSLNTPDTPDIIRRDWMEGDTVVAFFDSRVVGTTSAGADSTEYVLRRLEARVNAASLYRLEPDSTQAADSLAAPGDSLTSPDTVPSVVAAGDSLPGLVAAVDSVPRTESPTDSAALAGATDQDQVTVIRPGPEPAVHYVTAEEIIIIFVDGEVDRMEVKGLERGVHLDPRGRPRRAVVAESNATPPPTGPGGGS